MLARLAAAQRLRESPRDVPRDRPPRGLAALTAFVLLIAGGTAAAQEARVKAAYLFNFAKFIEWPESATSPGGPFVIGVLGEGPVPPALFELDGRQVRGRRVAVRSFIGRGGAGCRILFVDSDRTSAFAQESERWSAPGILTVGEGDEFLRAGGIIALVHVRGTIRYRINLGAAHASGINISSKILKLADRIEDFGGVQ